MLFVITAMTDDCEISNFTGFLKESYELTIRIGGARSVVTIANKQFNNVAY
jgi:hypothetical protein